MRQAYRGYLVTQCSDSYIVSSFANSPRDFSMVTTSLGTDSVVWCVERVTSSSIYLIAYFEHSISRKTHRVNGTTFYCLHPDTIFINS